MPLKLKSAVLLLFTLCFVLLVACNEDDLKEQEGKVQFSFVINDTENARTAEVPLENLVLSIKDSDGEFILEDEKLSLGFINDNYITEPISLLVGSYSLEKFLVVGNDGITYYATPLEGSDLAFLVEDPLPIAFDVATDEVIQLKPEVISTEEGTVEDFGFSEFSFEIVETFDVLLGVFVYSEEKSGFELTESNLVVYADGDSLTSKELFAATNKLTLPDRFDEFTLLIEKAEYRSFNYTFSADSLKNYQGDNANGPLEVVLASLSVAEGLVAYYPFNGNANDESGNEGNGDIRGATLIPDKNGNTNSAYLFDGLDDEIVIPYQSSFSALPLTISFWARFNDFNSAVLGTDIQDFSESGVWFSIGQSQSVLNKVAVSYGNGGSPSPSSRKTMISANMLELGQWYHIVGVVAQDELSIYVNGVKNNGDQSGSGTSFAHSQNDGSLGRVWDPNSFFDGTLDEVRIYNRELSDNEVAQLFALNN